MPLNVDLPVSQQASQYPVSEADRRRASESMRAAAKRLEARWAEEDKHVTVKTTLEEQRDLARRVVAWEKECSRATREDYELRLRGAAEPEKKKSFFSFLTHPWKGEKGLGRDKK